MDLDVTTVDRLLSTTRAVRKRLNLTRPVPDDVIAECVGLATQAPSAADAQNWRWVVVTDDHKRKEIADIRRTGDVEFLQTKIAELEPGSERRRLESSLYLLDHLHQAPVLVLPYVLDPELAGLEGQPVPPAVLYGSIYPAVWSFQLALRARGLGTTPLFAPDESAIADVVGAPESAHLASLLPVAYYTGESFKPANRRPLDEVLSWNGWSADR